MSKPYHSQPYFAQALDPIHIGTGGERLSRVDMAIVREAGTDLPKLPGTSLSGACRAYAAVQSETGKGRECAGQGNEKHHHCGECAVCRTFGFAKGDTGGQKGIAQFTDAHIVAFPVASTSGPLWVTSPEALAHIRETVAEPENTTIKLHGMDASGVLALGWLALATSGTFTIPSTLDKILKAHHMRRLALVPSVLFPTIVNDNLEVRTSVAINPGTGAAEEHALFTYEAIPTGTLFAWDVVYQGEKRDEAKTTVEQGFELFTWLGVGGMNTRGMGRLRVLDLGKQGEAPHA